VVAGTEDAVMMVESEIKEMTEEEVLRGVMFAHKGFQPVIEAIIELAEHAAKEPWDFQAEDISPLVQKIPDPEDGRSCHIVVTEAARTLLEKVRTERSAMLAERVSRLTPQQYETLVTALPVLEQLAEEAD